ncbi:MULTISPECIES: DMT family transporter [unclassified Ruegeria]|uniref:DMT family transporter n=1 Tax=unclassified Ruegeria TaxID=2625375 RepID=UPI001489FF62|nr:MULTISPECIES: DMT family transporter [unclassified Ruegeria]NOD61955.1 EamA family transporter [Ruegeria sp. HKCCD6109]NOD74666.1 EamA family transporter [Ruegeria sp. HKCCD4332]NOD88600.1 EamA family transporter [Ruegeria sp. HKCCD4318]NOD92314.1 EamA family transporter [Ruegeria sp. HKCCD4884]NOE12172.1 EamA family transporter [Ruegeria sp. HKCCD4318-2]
MTSHAVSSRPIAGMFWMFSAGLSFVVMTALVKSLGTTMNPIQAAFLRYALGLVFLLPALRSIMATRLTPRLLTLFGVRGVVHAVAVMLWFFAMTQIPLAEVTAMNYMTPVYVTLGAALFLGEKLAFRRIAAILVALVGVLIILRPGFREVSPGHLAMLGTALTLGGSYLLAKLLVRDVPPSVVVAHLSIWVTLALIPFAVAVWTQPSLRDLGVLFLVACFATAGHYFMTLALQAAPVAVTQPITFLQLIWATLLGAVVFHESVDVWVVAGGTLILCAVSFISWREAVLNRRDLTPPSIAPKL